MATVNGVPSVCVRLTFLVLCVTLVFVPTDAQWVIEDDGCRTPDRGVGNCVVISACEPILEFLRNAPRPLSSATARFLRAYHCGFEGRNVKVCCPSGPIPIPNQQVITTSRNPPPPDVTSHKNFNLLPPDCGPVDNGDRILGGNKTGLFEFPWMVLLSYQTDKGPDFRCGGTLISNRYILTAAHCITNLGKLTLLGVRLGEHNIDTPTDCEEQDGEQICTGPAQDIGIETTIPHPEYNVSPYSNDIGLIRLSANADVAVDNVKPICLPLTANVRNHNLTNIKMTVTGFGATETGRSSAELLKADIPTLPNTECNQTYYKRAPISHRQLCAGGKNNTDSCKGDSGGPLQMVAPVNNDARYVQHGVVSFGPVFCGLEGFPGVYTRVAYYMDWILDNLAP